MLEKALSEVTSDQAQKEIAWARTTIKHYQKECKRLDRDDGTITTAINFALKHENYALCDALRLVLKGEKLIKENTE